jgi:hypothetical protein
MDSSSDIKTISANGAIIIRWIMNVSYVYNDAPKVWDIYVNDVRRRMNATHLVNLYHEFDMQPPQALIDLQQTDDMDYPETDLTTPHVRNETDDLALQEQQPVRQAMEIHWEQIENLKQKIVTCTDPNETEELQRRLQIAEENQRNAAGILLSSILSPPQSLGFAVIL